jgi:hypothetical protein
LVILFVSFTSFNVTFFINHIVVWLIISRFLTFFRRSEVIFSNILIITRGEIVFGDCAFLRGGKVIFCDLTFLRRSQIVLCQFAFSTSRFAVCSISWTTNSAETSLIVGLSIVHW